MKYLEYREPIAHGTMDFPFALYRVAGQHPRYHMLHHWHMEYELIRVVEGRLHLTLDGVPLTAEPGETVVLTGGTLHSGIPEDCSYECMVFDMNILTREPGLCREEARAILGHERQVRQHMGPEAATAPYVRRMFETFGARRPGYRFAVVGALYGFLGAVIEHGLYEAAEPVSTGGKQRVEQLKAVLTFIKTSYHENLTLADLAAQVGMNQNYFCRFFREMTQKTPMEYLNYYRVECACERLASTAQSVTEIALGCGFNDPSYFIKVFKRHKGVTPSRYLREALVRGPGQRAPA